MSSAEKKTSLFITSLGLWLTVAPFSFGYSSMEVNDVVCGISLFILGLFSLASSKRSFFVFAALIGFWLQLAPLFFWAKDPVAYLNDTLVGMLVMFLVLFLPWISDEELKEEAPPGWSFNPSDWKVRRVTVLLALFAWFLARYLASYQLGYTQTVYDPFFGDGSLKVISSPLAKGFPISDAGMGAFGYSLEFLLGIIGSNRRWKTMPWVTILFSALVIPAGMISILLIISQPLLVGAWCGICLLIASCMLIMILLTIPEMAATFQLLKRSKVQGMFWAVFWKGDSSPAIAMETSIARNSTSEFGFTLPWNLVVSCLLGVWLIMSPAFFGDSLHAADSSYMAGPLLVACSVIAFSELIRNYLSWIVFFIGLGTIFSCFFLEGFSSIGFFNHLIVGILVATLSFFREMKKEKYGQSRNRS